MEAATKVVQAFLQSGKEYVCVMRLHAEVPEKRIKDVLNEFQGAIYQRPPVRASVKRRLRTRKIYYLDFLEMDERNVLFKVGCEAGTYIRKLCHDIGEALGFGAHMRELRRTRVGPFTEDRGLVTLHDISYLYSQWQETGDERNLRRFIQPMETSVELLPKIYIRDSAVDAVCHGANLAAPGVLLLDTKIQPGDLVVVSTQKGEAVALSKALVSTQAIRNMGHGLVAETRRVLMPRGVYPKMWRATK